ncbi:TPA: glycosyltransferase, partial [Streptococcus pneumoniae]
MIIPTHNRYESLIRAVKSCLHQSYKNIEVIK